MAADRSFVAGGQGRRDEDMDLLNQLENLGNWPVTGAAIIILLVAVGTALVIYWVLFKVLLRLAARPGTVLQHALVRRWRAPAKLLLPSLTLFAAVPSLEISERWSSLHRHLLSLLIIGGVAWLLAVTVLGLRELVLQRFDVEASDNLKAREVHTQVKVLSRILLLVILIIAAASMLMTFDQVRQIGVSLLASAGIAGIIVGFAAQRSLATLVAGIQIAITQPIRIDDVVIVEGEWGRIEEITLTYVVLRIWDLRRLIVPITYFLEKPFQNWTRVSADLLGTVFLYTDYSVPVAAVRAELERIVADEELWDGKVVGLQVTNASEKTLELRALVSAADSGAAWNLRCSVRERLIDYLQREYPHALPRLRAELNPRPTCPPSSAPENR